MNLKRKFKKNWGGQAKIWGHDPSRPPLRIATVDTPIGKSIAVLLEFQHSMVTKLELPNATKLSVSISVFFLSCTILSWILGNDRKSAVTSTTQAAEMRVLQRLHGSRKMRSCEIREGFNIESLFRIEWFYLRCFGPRDRNATQKVDEVLSTHSLESDTS